MQVITKQKKIRKPNNTQCQQVQSMVHARMHIENILANYYHIIYPRIRILLNFTRYHQVVFDSISFTNVP